MFILYAFILLVCLKARTNTHDLEVVDSGISQLKQNDMVVAFFVSVRHYGNQPRRLMATMLECCESFNEDEQDCDLIDLFGGDFGIIQPGSLRNFTMIYPNLYGYNRRGYCVVNIIHRSLSQPDATEIHHRIEFDTRFSTDAVPYVLQGWYNPDSLVLCETHDLDPLDHCNPVDCHLKYSGYRNYYNQKMKVCQRSPVCLTDVEKELPDIIYLPISNKCRNLEKGIPKEDMAKLALSQGISVDQSQMVDIRCHHGEVDPRTGLCICYKGWKSEPFDPESYIPGKTIYSMCTIKCAREDNYKYLPALAGLVIAMWLLFFVFCCEKNNLFMKRKKGDRNSSPQVVYYPITATTPAAVGEESKYFYKKHNHYATHFSLPLLKKPLVKTKRKLLFLERNF